MKTLHVIGGFVLVALVSLAGVAGWRYRAKHAIARPAPALAEAAPKPVPTVHADGRVVTAEGGRVTASAELTGTVDRVLVREGTVVRAGDTLATFRGGEQVALVDEAYAQAREAHASVRFLDEEVVRTKALFASGSVPKSAVDKAVQERDAARARRSAAGASARRFTSAVARMRIVAPISGTIIARTVEPGETVAIGTPLFVIADLSRLRIDAEVDELDALRVVPGMNATVTVDGADGQPLTGKVDDIGLLVAPRALRPQDPARPTDGQILHVKIGLESTPALKLGQRVSVSIAGQPAKI